MPPKRLNSAHRGVCATASLCFITSFNPHYHHHICVSTLSVSLLQHSLPWLPRLPNVSKETLYLLTLHYECDFLTTCPCIGLAGYTDYIMALKKPVDDAVIEQAKADVEAVNGKVIYEIKYGFQALIISLPNDQYTTFENKDYVDFIEEDQQGKKVVGEGVGEGMMRETR